MAAVGAEHPLEHAGAVPAGRHPHQLRGLELKGHTARGDSGHLVLRERVAPQFEVIRAIFFGG